MPQITTITNALQQAITGEAPPSMGDPAFGAVISALTALTAPGAAIDAQALRMHEQIGRAAMALLLNHYLAAMNTERTCALLRAPGSEL